MSVESAAKVLNKFAAKDAESARLRAENERLKSLAVDVQAFVNDVQLREYTKMLAHYGLRIVGGQVEEIQK